jgi:DNA repair exonuclease SbcCD nuclease subunit
MPKPDAIICGDLHLRDDIPLCRTDDYWEAQQNKMNFLRLLQLTNGCPVLDAGDVFNSWKPSHYLMAWAISHLPLQFYTVPGNHDLPQHNYEYLDKSGLAVLVASGKAHILRYFDFPKFRIHCVEWGGVVPKPETDKFKILIIHALVWEGEPPFPGAENLGGNALQMLEKYPEYDLIISGHNHKSFLVSSTGDLDGRVLVNPGSMMRMSADQEDHVPHVAMLYIAEDINKNKPICRINWVPFPISQNVISREHIDIGELKDSRIASFVERLKTTESAELSFRGNMERFISINKLEEEVQKMIWEIIG